MRTLGVSAVDASAQARVYALLTLAFAADPVERWLYPQAQDYLANTEVLVSELAISSKL